MMEITKANLFDLNALRALEQVCFPLDAWPLLDLISVLTIPGVIRLKVVEDGQMIGFAAADPHPIENISWIATICINPAQQGRGFGRALMNAIEAHINTPIVKLCVRPNNDVAIRMYKSMGYEPIDTWRHYYNDGSDSLVMQKLLFEPKVEL
jgi:ribosomal-protein-alanine N-acetyltransferase